MANNASEASAHPLEQIQNWITEKEGAEIPIVEFFGEGPSLLGIDETTLREWVNDGIARRMIRLGGLADSLQLVPDVDLGDDLPSQPPSRTGY